MRVVLAAMDEALAAAWEAAFAEFDEVQVHRGSILDVEVDALVSPANSFGFMDGGIDALYSEHFGWDLQLRLRRAILEQHAGELLIGQAAVVPTENDRHPWLIAAPTMRVPMALGRETVNPYLATRAALLLARDGRVGDGIKSLAFPGMGTGVGRVPSQLCARQMRAAVETVLRSPAKLPQSWAEASEDHQLLYTDRPTRLQY
ncbi:macro domain-containing protein [Caulobacter sp. NIBR1757]|uniref:macro domain-containing protein n=1 Tax=Caulobacter sp. NIBR1757 TaxID=3016000 RepID=UPI0022F1419A|nr:macro domain-containing protein [Caulobacter sp. NIBR1757]WGM37461.1 hypothetical protein AMEJIAPC_00359 [Caulobacter sp. NIBR1757]